MGSTESDANWLLELIKVLPSLLTVLLLIGIFVAYHREIRLLFDRVKKFRGLGIEAEFSTKTMDSAIADQQVQVSVDDRDGALRRLTSISGSNSPVGLITCST